MRKNQRLIILVMALFSILLLILIVGPEAGRAIAAANDGGNSAAATSGDSDSAAVPAGEENAVPTSAGQIDSLKPDVVDSSDESTGPGIGNEPSDVTEEIALPEAAFELKYDKYPLTYTYLLVEKESVNIRKGPSPAESVLKAEPKNEKLNYIETITNETGGWHHVTWQENDSRLFGFVTVDSVTMRTFQFDKMYQAVLTAEKARKAGPLTFISNYHNLKGNAPLYHGGEVDKTGGRRSQSAPGYPNPADLREFSYLSDGTLVRVLSAGSQYTRVALVQDEKIYFVPNQYVASPAAVFAVNKAVVIDRTNQNEAVFEKIGLDWKIVSYTLATTGTTGEYHQPTSLGFYYGIEKRERFYYYEDGTTKIQGYAPYAIRFSGGAYVHGVPVNYKYDADGNRIDPGKVEYSRTLGTVPLSHKCVRNYTSHAKFLYDWYTPGDMAVIVIE
ncbi:MAG TPA: L,D-transpeptidase [Anaerovoracaceae bacterium]|nr:L,D-transpeptidase [Anaerovoracaceae bacterium]